MVKLMMLLSAVSVAAGVLLGCAHTASPATTGARATAAASPTSSVIAPARIVSRGDPARRMVALTFDVGADSDDGAIAQTLDTLRGEHVRATFAVTGLWAEQHHALVLAIASGGHQLINGTYDGASFTGASSGGAELTAAERALELQRTETTIYHLTGRTTRPFVRPPHGDLDAAAPIEVARAGYTTIVLASADSASWPAGDLAAFVRQALARAEPGAIYELHTSARLPDAPGLAAVIDGLRAQGYTFGAISELLGA